MSLNWFLVSALHSRMPSRMAFRCVVTTGMGNRMATTCMTLIAECKDSGLGGEGGGPTRSSCVSCDMEY